MNKRVTLVLPGKAVAKLIQESEEQIYFDYMAVTRLDRRTGICTEFVKFTADRFKKWPELDIRHQSRVAQRVAKNLGYTKVGRSLRYLACELWLKEEPRSELPQSRLRVKSRVAYRNGGRLTEVLYLQQEK
jgi:hypothetical protein